MFKIKKLLIHSLSLSFIILYIIEVIKYLIIDSNIFGVYYLLSSLLIIFFLLPVAYNYKRHYSKARISKIIIIIILGIFTSYILEKIVLSNMNYTDSSKDFISSIFVIKNILKPIIYSLLLIFLIIETKAYLLLKKIYPPKSKKS